MQIPGIIGGVAIFGVIGACWGHIKGVLHRLYNVFVIESQIHEQVACEAMGYLLLNEFRRANIGPKAFTGSIEYVKPRRRNEAVAFEMLPKTATVFWRGWRPIVVSKEIWFDKVSLHSLRFVFNHDKLLQEATTKFNDMRQAQDDRDRYEIRRYHGSLGRKPNFSLLSLMASKKDDGDGGDKAGDDDEVQNRRFDRRPLGFTLEELGQPKQANSADMMALSPRALVALEEATRWRRSEDWYKERSIPWKLGWLLHGPTGTGKTMLARCVGQTLNMPINWFDVATMTNHDFMGGWKSALQVAPSIVLLEDIDTVFDGRKNIACSDMEHGLTFDFLLNVIDGVQNSDGIFLVITTNHPDKLARALASVEDNGTVTRPGRIDRVIEMEPITSVEQKLIIAERVFVGVDRNEWEHLITSKPETGAQVQDVCTKKALELKWS